LIQIWIEYWKNKNLERSNKIQIHSNLLGCEHSLLQYFHSYFLSDIYARSSQPYAKILAVAFIDFKIAKGFLEQREEEQAKQYVNREFTSRYEKSADLGEALRAKERSENLQLQIGNAQERFWICIGQIKASFKDIRIKDFIEEIEKAEKAIKATENDITQQFMSIEDEIKEGLSSMCLDRSNRSRFADDPNDNRDNFLYVMGGKIEKKRDLAQKNARDEIDQLESKIDDLLNYVDKIINDSSYCRDCKLFCSDKTCPLEPQSPK
jgi:hypothetical protein